MSGLGQSPSRVNNSDVFARIKEERAALNQAMEEAKKQQDFVSQDLVSDVMSENTRLRVDASSRAQELQKALQWERERCNIVAAERDGVREDFQASIETLKREHQAEKEAILAELGRERERRDAAENRRDEVLASSGDAQAREDATAERELRIIVETERDRLKEESSGLAEQRMRLMADVEGLQHSVNAHKAENSTLSAEAETLRAEMLHKQETFRAELKHEKEKHEKALKHAWAEWESLQQQAQADKEGHARVMDSLAKGAKMEIAAHEVSLTELRRTLSLRDGELGALRAEASATAGELTAKVSSLEEALDSQAAEHGAARSDLVAVVEELRAKCAEMEEGVLRAQERAAEDASAAYCEVDQLQEALTVRERDLRNAKERASELDTTVVQLRMSQTKREMYVDELHEALREMERRLVDDMNSMSSMLADKDEAIRALEGQYQEQARDAMQQMEELSGEKEGLESRILGFEEEAAERRRDLEELEERYGTLLESKIRDADEAAGLLNQEMEGKEADNKKLVAKIQSLERQLQDTATMMEQSNARTKGKEGEVASLRRELEQLQSRHSSEVLKAGERASRDRSVIEQKDEELRVLEGRHRAERSEEREAEEQRRQETKRQMQQKADELDKAIAQRDADIREMQERSLEVVKDLDKQAVELAESHGRERVLEASVQAFELKVKGLNERLEGMEGLRSEKLDLLKEAQELHAQVADLRAGVGGKHEELEKERAKGRDLEADCKAKEESIRGLQTELTASEQREQDLKGDVQAQVFLLNESKDLVGERETEIKGIKARVEALLMMQSKMSSDLASQSERLEQESQSTLGATTRCIDLEAEVAEAKGKCEGLASRVEEVEEACAARVKEIASETEAQVQEKDAEIERLSRRVGTLTESGRKAADEASMRMAEKLSMIHAMRKAAEERDLAMGGLVKKISKREVDAKEAAEQAAGLKQQLEKALEAHKGQRDADASSIEALSADKALLQTEKEELEGQVRAAAIEVAEARTHIADLRLRLEVMAASPKTSPASSPPQARAAAGGGAEGEGGGGLEGMEERVKETVERARGAEQRAKEAESEAADLRSAVAERDARIAALDQEHEKQQANMQEREKHIEEMSLRIADMESAEVSDFDRGVATAQRSFAERLEAFAAQMASKNTEVEDLEKKQNQLQHLLDEAAIDFVRIEGKLSAKDATVADLTHKLVEATKESAAKASRIEDLDEAISALHIEKANAARAASEELDLVLTDKNSRLEKLQARVSDLEADKTLTDETLEAIRKDVAELEEAAGVPLGVVQEKFEHDASLLRAEKQHQVDELKRLEAAKDKQISDLSGELQLREEATSALEAEVSELQQQLGAHVDSNARDDQLLKEQSASVKEEMLGACMWVAESAGHLAGLMGDLGERAAVDAVLADARGLISAGDGGVGGGTVNVEHLVGHSQHLRRVCEGLDGCLKAYSAAVEARESSLSSSDADSLSDERVESLQAQVTEMLGAIEELQGADALAMKRLESRWQSRVEQLEAHLEERTNRMNAEILSRDYSLLRVQRQLLQSQAKAKEAELMALRQGV